MPALPGTRCIAFFVRSFNHACGDQATPPQASDEEELPDPEHQEVERGHDHADLARQAVDQAPHAFDFGHGTSFPSSG
jgi:hypothetical protein